jgi:hypothetical protein
MQRLFGYDEFAYGEAVALIEYLRREKGTFFSCSQLGEAPVSRGISFRFDVHARDIPGAYGFLAALYRYNVPGTFFLLANYSDDERLRLAEFRALVQRVRLPVEIGLHDSPVDSYLISQKFRGNGVDYWRWLQSEKSLHWLSSLARSASDQEAFHGEVMDALVTRVSWMKQEFGNVQTMASHGGEINQMFRKRLPELGVTGEFISSLFSENWITDERLARVGLDADVEQFRREAPLLYQVTDGGGQIRRMLENVNLYLIRRERAVQILIHPYTWAGPLGRSGGTRDAELSVLLGARPGNSRPMGGRAWYQRLLRRRLMIVPRGAGQERGREDRGAGSPAESGDRPAIVSATVGDVQADARYADVAARLGSALVVEGGEDPGKTTQLAMGDFLDYVSTRDGARGEGSIVIGRSVGRYGPLVAGAIASLVCSRTGQSPSPSPAAGLAAWILNSLDRQREGKKQGGRPLERKELSYFLFSSSRRSQVLKRILDEFFGGGDIACLVDHGAGIGMVPLSANFACDNIIRRVVCSEIRHDFVIIGSSLWKVLGCEGVLEYQECSAVDFAYPDEVSVVLFAQMLFRIPPEHRQAVIASAWQALAPGGLLIINELMDRDQSTASSPIVTSRELLGYLPSARESRVFWGGSGAKSNVRLQGADAGVFRRSDNFIVLRR